MHTETFNHSQRPRERAVGHDPHHHVHRLGRQRDEIPKIVVRGCRLRKAAIRFHLHRVYQVGKLDGVLNEEHRNIVSDQIPVALLGVKFDGKTPHVTWSVNGPGSPRDRRESREDWSSYTHFAQNLCGGVLYQ